MTQEEFFQYLHDTAEEDCDEIVCVEYHENGFSYFGIYNPNSCYGGPYRLYEINQTGDCVSLCNSTHYDWQTCRWPNASYPEYQKYITRQ